MKNWMDEIWNRFERSAVNGEFDRLWPVLFVAYVLIALVALLMGGR